MYSGSTSGATWSGADRGRIGRPSIGVRVDFPKSLTPKAGKSRWPVAPRCVTIPAFDAGYPHAPPTPTRSSRHRTTHRPARQRPPAVLLHGGRLSSLPARSQRNRTARRWRDPCLRADDQPCPPAGDACGLRLHKSHDASARPALRAPCESVVPPHRHIVGRAFQGLPGRQRRASAPVPSLHRTQPATRLDGGGPARLSVVCANRGQSRLSEKSYAESRQVAMAGRTPVRDDPRIRRWISACPAHPDSIFPASHSTSSSAATTASRASSRRTTIGVTCAISTKSHSAKVARSMPTC